MPQIYDFTKKQNNWESCFIHLTDKYEQQEAALMQGDIRLFSVGDISVIAGQPKSRKTFLISSIAAAFLNDDGFMGLHTEIENPRLLIVDTEQSRNYVLKGKMRVYKLLGWDFSVEKEDIFRVMSLREYSPADRKKALEDTIITMKPNLVLLDGFADLITDTNENKESAAEVCELMRMSTQYNCHICSVLHTNPNSEKMRGHAGSELQRKAETVMLVTKMEEITTVSPQFTRGIEFRRFSFRVNERGLPETCDVVINEEQKQKEIFEKIFFDVPQMGVDALRLAVMQETGVKRSTAYNRVKKAIDNGILVKGTNSQIALKYSDVKEAKEEELQI